MSAGYVHVNRVSHCTPRLWTGAPRSFCPCLPPADCGLLTSSLLPLHLCRPPSCKVSPHPCPAVSLPPHLGLLLVP